MALDVEFLLGAEIEFLDIYARRGEDFYSIFDGCLNQIRHFPESAPVYTPPFRRLLIPRTPVAIFYTIEGNRIFVQAVLDLRMSPERISERLKSSK